MCCSATSSTVPRGRIYLIKEMLENDRPATPEVVKHIDRCLSCLSCMTTCPSGVNYMHLVDHGRRHIEKTFKRPWFDRMLRRAFAIVLPSPRLFRAAMWMARLGAPFAGLMPAQLRAALALVPRSCRRLRLSTGRRSSRAKAGGCVASRS